MERSNLVGKVPSCILRKLVGWVGGVGWVGRKKEGRCRGYQRFTNTALNWICPLLTRPHTTRPLDKKKWTHSEAAAIKSGRQSPQVLPAEPPQRELFAACRPAAAASASAAAVAVASAAADSAAVAAAGL